MMIGIVLAFALTPSACPMTVGIGQDGSLYSSRFAGWYKVSTHTLESDLTGGCYNDASPIPVTSVTIFVAPDAAKPRVELVFSMLKKAGWARDKVSVQPWSGYPKPPR